MKKVVPSKKRSIEDISDEEFALIKQYYESGDCKALSDSKKEILERMRCAYSLLRRYPRKSVAAVKLQARFPGLSREQAFADLRNTIRYWNVCEKVDREWLESWFIDKLMEEIHCPGASETARAKNLGTLQKYLAINPPVPIDPKLMESNQIFIQFNVNGKTISLSEQIIAKLPAEIRHQLIDSANSEICEDTAYEILNS